MKQSELLNKMNMDYLFHKLATCQQIKRVIIENYSMALVILVKDVVTSSYMYKEWEAQ